MITTEQAKELIKLTLDSMPPDALRDALDALIEIQDNQELQDMIAFIREHWTPEQRLKEVNKRIKGIIRVVELLGLE